MDIKKQAKIPSKNVSMDGAKNISMQILTEGAGNFTMRRFVVRKNGCTPFHKHAWEHEVYVLKGNGCVVAQGKTMKGKKKEVKTAKKETPIAPGTVVYVEPNKLHQFRNKGNSAFEFICVVPSEKVYRKAGKVYKK